MSQKVRGAHRFHRDPARAAHKASLAAAALNVAQMLILVAVAAVLIFRPQALTPQGPVRVACVLAAALMLLLGALSLLNGRAWDRMLLQNDMLRDAIAQLETLNTRLRTQRHDFLNHLQVIYSLLEMEETAEARKYIDALCGSLQARALPARTAFPAVNALLQVKLPQCERRGVDVALQLESDLKGISVAEWELCRILGNLIDNAADALSQSQNPGRRLTVRTAREGALYVIACANNGPAIPAANLARVFNQGFTTKAEGRGLGLNIVKTIVEEAGGSVSVQSDAEKTVFTCRIP